MRAPLAYRPLPLPLQRAGAGAAVPFVLAPAVIAFLSSNPIYLAGAAAAALVIGAASRAGAALRFALRYGALLGVMVILVNALVNHRGETILVRGWELPVFGRMDVTLESALEGAVLAARIVIVLMAFAVYSACVDPDRVLRAVRPLARRSALTTSLIVRLVPLAATDLVRLREAAALRGPAAAPASRAVLARRLVGGSLDRSVDIAATLDLRGFASESGPARRDPRRASGSSRDRHFLAAAIAMLGLATGARLAGAGEFDAYPSLEVSADAVTVIVGLAPPLIAVAPFVFYRLARRPAGEDARG